MADSVTLLEPKLINRNPDNPRLIFHQDELLALEESIEKQGILVPLTVYKDDKGYFILDGERRWRCSIKLGLSRVPVIVQPKPDRMRNIMMMFAIHKARKDWDPLPTAYKLVELEEEFTQRNNRKPTEAELAGISSLSRGEVRRLRKLLGIPEDERELLMRELEKPRGKQEITADQILEATKGAEALRKRDLIDEKQEQALRKAIIGKFRNKTIVNTVAPRKLVRLARAVDRQEVSESAAKRAIDRLTRDASYSIDQAFLDTVEQADFEHGTEQLTHRLLEKLAQHKQRRYKMSPGLKAALTDLKETIDLFIKS